MSTKDTSNYSDGRSALSSDVTADAATRDEQARLNANRLSLAALWRSTLDEPHQPDFPVPENTRDASFRQANQALRIWQEAEHDPILLAMIRQDEDDILGPEALDEAELQQAKSRFAHRMQATQHAAITNETPQVLEATSEHVASLTVGDVVEAMERETTLTASRRDNAPHRSALEPLRASHEVLPAHITAKAMSEFWKQKRLSIPRELASAFNQTARLLLMGRAAPGARLSLARPAASSGLSDAVAKLVAHAEQAGHEDSIGEEQQQNQLSEERVEHSEGSENSSET